MIGIKNLCCKILLLMIFQINNFSISAQDLHIEPTNAYINYSNENLYYSAGTAAIGASLFLVDEPLRQFVQKNRGSVGEAFFIVPNFFGSGYSTMGLVGGIYLYGEFSDDIEVINTSKYLLQSALMTSASTFALKFIFGRARPYMNRGNLNFNFFETNDSLLSLPSGHTSQAFSHATIISRRFDNPYITAASYTLAGLTALSRVYYDKHWLSDTFLGAVAGTVTALIVLELNESDEKKYYAHESIQPAAIKIFSISLQF